jgi:hypothetical protein
MLGISSGAAGFGAAKAQGRLRQQTSGQRRIQMPHSPEIWNVEDGK